MRFLLGVGRTCPKVGLFGETGWVPFTMTIKFNILRFRNIIMNMEKDRITSKVSLFQNWAWKTRALLESIKDYGGVLSIDKIRNELAKLELDDWKMVVNEIPNLVDVFVSIVRLKHHPRRKTTSGDQVH